MDLHDHFYGVSYPDLPEFSSKSKVEYVWIRGGLFGRISHPTKKISIPEKSPSPKNSGDKNPQSPGIKIPRFRRIPNQRDKNPEKSHPTKKSHPSDNESAENPGKNR